MAIGQEENARAMQQEWVTERLTVWAGRGLAVLVLPDNCVVGFFNGRLFTPLALRPLLLTQHVAILNCCSN